MTDIIYSIHVYSRCVPGFCFYHVGSQMQISNLSRSPSVIAVTKIVFKTNLI